MAKRIQETITNKKETWDKKEQGQHIENSTNIIPAGIINQRG